MPELPYKPNPLEAALLTLRLVEAKDKERKETGGEPITRFRVSEMTLKNLWRRKRLERDFIVAVEEWLLEGGWALLFAGSTYAMIKVPSVEGWARLSSKRIEHELEAVSRGKFKFETLRHLLTAEEDIATTKRRHRTATKNE
jgi:hypothetical protein